MELSSGPRPTLVGSDNTTRTTSSSTRSVAVRVADGMGGHASGEIASQIAITDFRNAVEARKDLLDAYVRANPASQPKMSSRPWKTPPNRQGWRSLNAGPPGTREARHGTTLSALLLLANAPHRPRGRQPVYMVRQNQAVQLTRTTRLVNELIRHGKVTRESLAASPMPRTRTRSRARSAFTRPPRSTRLTWKSSPATNSCFAPTDCTAICRTRTSPASWPATM